MKKRSNNETRIEEKQKKTSQNSNNEIETNEDEKKRKND